MHFPLHSLCSLQEKKWIVGTLDEVDTTQERTALKLRVSEFHATTFRQKQLSIVLFLWD